MATHAEPRRAILLRVGIDQTFGKWNAPMRVSDLTYDYYPIPENAPIRPGLGVRYDDCAGRLAFPEHLRGRLAHLDPDFRHLTYGDRGTKGAQIANRLKPGDLIVFYASFRDVEHPRDDLTYALFGQYEIAAIARAIDVPEADWAKNAHTRRRLHPEARDVVVTAEPARSGRFERLVPVGERRSGAYRVRSDLLDAWGGLSARDGFLQRSGGLIFVNDPERFVSWLNARAVGRLHQN